MRRRQNEPRRVLRALSLLLLWWVVGAASLEAQERPKQQFLPKAKIAEYKKKACTLFHVWATWCLPCIDELPKFLLFVAKHPKVTPIVIDVSIPYVQNNFSKKWMEQLAPPFTTYLKPAKGTDQNYLATIEKPWPNQLPYNALFDDGKRKGRWLGTLNLETFAGELTRLCH